GIMKKAAKFGGLWVGCFVSSLPVPMTKPPRTVWPNWVVPISSVVGPIYVWTVNVGTIRNAPICSASPVMDVLLHICLLDSRVKPCRCGNGHGLRPWDESDGGYECNCRREGEEQKTHEVILHILHLPGFALKAQSEGNLKAMAWHFSKCASMPQKNSDAVGEQRY